MISTSGATQRLIRAAFYAAACVIAVLSLIPQQAMPEVDVWDKLQHALAYAALGGIGAAGWRFPVHRLIIAAYVITLGGALEVAQALIPGRLPSEADAAANALGAVTGMGACIGALAVFRRLTHGF